MTGTVMSVGKSAGPKKNETPESAAKKSARLGVVARKERAAPRLGGVAPSPAQIREGLDVRWIRELSAALELPEERLTEVVQISSATWHRRQQAGRLNPTESDRVANVIRALAAAVEFFDGDLQAASRWMKRVAPAFEGETPLRHCDTSTGAQEVIDLLARLEHGIPA